MNLREITQGFGVVTVINAKCVSIEYLNNAVEGNSWSEFCKTHTPAICAQKIIEVYENAKAQGEACYIDTLKVANITIEGPSKTITGGQYANPLIKFGKTATCEMTDALGHYDALKLLGGVEVDSGKQMHFTSKFGKSIAILGDTYVIDRESGEQVDVLELIYQFLPNSIISLTQDAEGDATVFDLTGSLMATDVLKEAGETNTYYHGAFYSIIEPISGVASTIDYRIYVKAGTAVTLTEGTGEVGATIEIPAVEGYQRGSVVLQPGKDVYEIELEATV